MGANLGKVTEPSRMCPKGYWRGELLVRLYLKHELGGSVKELKVGVSLGKVTEPNKMSLGVESCWRGCRESMNRSDQ